MRSRSFLMLGGALAILVGSGAARAQVKRQEIIQEIQAAFTAWEQVPCSNLKFKYGGELDTFTLEKKGAILLYFGNSSSTWIHGDNAYWTKVNIELETTGEITSSIIAMNAQKFWWSIGKEKSQIDIRTAVQHMIPTAIGYYVGEDTLGGNLASFIKYDYVEHALHPLHILGAQAIYFQADGGCVQPGEPPICGKGGITVDSGLPVLDLGAGDLTSTVEAGAPADLSLAEASTPLDAGAPAGDVAITDASAPAADTAALPADAGGPPVRLCIYHSMPNDPPSGKPYHWAAMPIEYYIYIPADGKLPGGTGATGDPLDGGVGEGGIGGDGQTCAKNEDCAAGEVCTVDGRCVKTSGDDGCCRVSHASSERLPLGLMLLLGAGLLLLRRRQR